MPHNVCRGEALRKVNLMRQTKTYRKALATRKDVEHSRGVQCCVKSAERAQKRLLLPQMAPPLEFSSGLVQTAISTR